MARGTNADDDFISSTVSSIDSQLNDQHDPVRRLVNRAAETFRPADGTAVDGGTN